VPSFTHAILYELVNITEDPEDIGVSVGMDFQATTPIPPACLSNSESNENGETLFSSGTPVAVDPEPKLD
jgi:hypothetical protein